MKYRKCEICGMKTKRKDGHKRFFMARFPLDEARCKQWVKFTAKVDLAYVPIEKLHKNKFICGKHFTDRHFKKKKTELKKHAVPTIWPFAPPLSDELLAEFPYHLHAGLKPVPVCENLEVGIMVEIPATQSSSHKVLHRFPHPEKDKERFNSWLFAMSLNIFSFDNEHIYKYRRVCRNHFAEKYLCRNNRLSNIAVPTMNVEGCNKLKNNNSFELPQISLSAPSTPKDTVGPSKSQPIDTVQPSTYQANISTDILFIDVDSNKLEAPQVLPTLYYSPKGLEVLGNSPKADIKFGKQTNKLKVLGVSPKTDIKFGKSINKLKVLRVSSKADTMFGKSTNKLKVLGVSPKAYIKFGKLTKTLEVLGDSPKGDINFGKATNKLEVFGDSPKAENKFGKPTNEDLASRWQEMLENGIGKDVKDQYYEEYLIPENCQLLVPPALNSEVKVCLSEKMVKRDALLFEKQKQTSVAIAALNKAMEMIIAKEHSTKILKPISDACKLLCDSHFIETNIRREFILSDITPEVKEQFGETKRDK